MMERYVVRQRDVYANRKVAEESEYGQREVEKVLPDMLMRKFHLRAGFRQSCAATATCTRKHLVAFIQELVQALLVLAQHGSRTHITLDDVIRACRLQGIQLYGFDDMCAIQRGGRETLYHVTEMVELPLIYNQWQESNGEPDNEPASRYAKTDFVRNYENWQARTGEVENVQDEESEWSWFGDSDDESNDSDFSDDDGQDDKMEDAVEESRDALLHSLSSAQDVVDEQLLSVSTESTEDDFMDSLPGQGDLSDCDEPEEPTDIVQEQSAADMEEEDLWTEFQGLFQLNDEDAVQDLLSKEDRRNEYLISRPAFLELFRNVLQFSLGVSSVALSALHNATEQYIHKSLSEGNLRSAVTQTLAEAFSEKLEEKENKVSDLEQELADLKAAFRAKEAMMQSQIKALEEKAHANSSPKKRKALATMDTNTSGPENSPSMKTDAIDKVNVRLTKRHRAREKN